MEYRKYNTIKRTHNMFLLSDRISDILLFFDVDHGTKVHTFTSLDKEINKEINKGTKLNNHSLFFPVWNNLT